MKYKIGELEFNNKSEITSTYKSILHSYELKDKLNRDDSILVYHLLQNHPGRDIKMSKPITSIFVGAAQHGTRCFYLNYNDGTNDDFSYTQCIKNTKKV